MSDPIAEAASRIVDSAVRLYPSREQRVAMRGALGDAAALADAITDDIQKQHSRGVIVTKAGREKAAVSRRVADAIWAMRDKISATDD